NREPTIVRSEYYEGVVREVQFVELPQDATDAVVNALQHRRVERIGVSRAGLDGRTILGDEIALRGQRDVRREMREVEEERFLTTAFDEFLRFDGQAVSEVFAGRGLLKAGHRLVAISERREIAGRRAAMVAGDVPIESVVLRK